MTIDGMHQSKKKAASSESVDFEDTDIEVAEWLEGERLEHEKRMQALGCGRSLRKSDESH